MADGTITMAAAAELIRQARADERSAIHAERIEVLDAYGRTAVALALTEIKLRQAEDVAARLVRVICSQEADVWALMGETDRAEMWRDKANALNLELRNAITERDNAHIEVAELRERVAQAIEAAAEEPHGAVTAARFFALGAAARIARAAQ